MNDVTLGALCLLVLGVGQADAQIRLRNATVPEPVDCTLLFTEPASETFTASAGSGSVTVNAANADCAFFVRIPGVQPWLTVTPIAGSGTALLTYTVTANPDGETRQATFEVVQNNIALSFLVVQQGSEPLPNTPPPSPTNPSPTNGATNVEIGAPLSATVSDYTACSVLFGTTNPPTAEIELGPTCAYAPTGMAYSRTYFWRLKPRNAFGTTTGPVWSFTTKPNPTPVDPDPLCASTTTSPTGYNPVHWTACRQDIYDQMEADYLAVCPAGVSAPICAATPATWGGRLFKESKRLADSTGLIYQDMGEFKAWMVQATGCATKSPTGVRHADAAYALLRQLMAEEMSTTEPAPYDFVYVTNGNSKRVQPLKFIAILDTIKPCITTLEFDAANLKIAQFLQSVRLNGWAHSGLRIGDWDNDLGGCFGIWVHHLLNPTMPLAIENYTNYNPVTGETLNNIGGLDPVANMATFRPDAAGATCRDYIKWWTTITPRSSSEGTEYNLANLTFIVRGRDAVMTLTGEDHFPELLTLMQGEADFIRHIYSPDLIAQMDYGDVEQAGRDWKMAQFTNAVFELAGALQGTTPGRQLHDMILELETLYPLGTSTGLIFVPHGSTPLIFYNPYDTQVEWRSEISYLNPDTRLTTRRSHLTNTNASQLIVYAGGPLKYNTTLNIPQHGDHNYAAFGDWQLWCGGNWCVNHPWDYAGPNTAGLDAGNNPIVYGQGRLESYNRMTARHDAAYSSVLMQQGGSMTHTGWCGSSPVPPFLNEWTRHLVYLPNDTVVVYDRGDVETSIVNYDTCYHPDQRKQMDPFKGIDKELIINHTSSQPTQAGNVFTWTTDGGKNAKMSFLFPTANLSHTIVDEGRVLERSAVGTADPTFGYVWRYDAGTCYPCSIWYFHYNAKPEMLDYHVRTRVTTDLQFNTFMSVHQFGAETAGTLVPLEDAGKVQGVHINPVSGNDVVALFNSQQGTDIDDNYRDPDHQTQVPAQQLRESGFQVTWNPSTSTTLMLWHGLNPANTWSYAIDGGAPVSITPDDGNVDGEVPGHWSGSVSATAGVPHTIVVTAGS